VPTGIYALLIPHPHDESEQRLGRSSGMASCPPGGWHRPLRPFPADIPCTQLHPETRRPGGTYKAHVVPPACFLCSAGGRTSDIRRVSLRPGCSAVATKAAGRCELMLRDGCVMDTHTRTRKPDCMADFGFGCSVLERPAQTLKPVVVPVERRRRGPRDREMGS